jgi:drug/metabolite transporter (DMT)-like permease
MPDASTAAAPQASSPHCGAAGDGGMRIDRARLLRFGAPPLFVLLWANGFIFVKIGLADADPLTLLAARYVLVELILIPAALLLRAPLPRGGAAWRRLAVVGVLVQAVYFASVNLSLEFGLAPGASALITSLQPIVVALAAPFLSGETVSARRWLGLALGLGGTVAVILSRSSLDALPVGGLLWSVAALGGMTGGTLYERRFGIRQHPVTASMVQCGVGLIVVLPLAALFEPMRLHPGVGLVLSLGYLVLGNSIVAITLLLAMIRVGEASRVSALFFLVPPITALVAWGVLGETLPPAGWAGMAVSAAGVAIVTLERRPARAA